MNKVHRLLPAYKDYLWGGHRLKEYYGKVTELSPLAESWELSAHPNGESRLADSGETLSSYLRKHPGALGEAAAKYDRFPILVKLIDAAENLSVQVHPDDSYALEHEGEWGKTEVWYIVEAAPDAFIYYGFREVISRAEFVLAIQEERLCDLLNKVPVKAGESYLIPAGTIHVIGAGCLIAEVQQNSNVTYRVFDYGRRDKDGRLRPLHIEQALAVTRTEPVVAVPDPAPHLARTPYFTCDVLDVSTESILESDGRSFRHLLVLDGRILITYDGRELSLAKGQSAFADADALSLSLSGLGRVLVSYVE